MQPVLSGHKLLLRSYWRPQVGYLRIQARPRELRRRDANDGEHLVAQLYRAAQHMCIAVEPAFEIRVTEHNHGIPSRPTIVLRAEDAAQLCVDSESQEIVHRNNLRLRRPKWRRAP